MYGETTGLMFPYFHSFDQEAQQLNDELCRSQKPNASLDLQNTIDDALWGGEGDLFRAPEPMIEEQQQAITLDPMSMIVIASGEDPLGDVFNECKKDLLAKEENNNEVETPLYEALGVAVRNQGNENAIFDEKSISEGSLPKSASSTCLISLDHQIPGFLDFASCGIRRAFSEGDIKTFGANCNGNKNSGLVQSSTTGRTRITTAMASEDRRVKLSRYKDKKARRNFGPKIKYACRKALADSQPRIRGRFAKNEDAAETWKKR